MRNYHIIYPSGKELNVTGNLSLLPPFKGQKISNPFIDDGKQTIFIDPRATVYDGEKIVYTGCKEEDMECKLPL
jgi:hypothetical protein